METTDLHPLLDDFTSNIDDLEDALAPILRKALSHTTSKLPLLDKAKLYVLATYAIESILFSHLRVNGVDAKSHPVFQELTRVKEYFGKIKIAETAGAGSRRNVTLDKDAANRFIRHGLSGNDKFDRVRAERVAREKAGAKRKLEDMAVGTHTRFDAPTKRIKASDSEQNGERASGVDAGDIIGGSVATSDADTGEPLSAKRKAQLERREARRMRKVAQMGDGEPVTPANGTSDDIPSGSADDADRGVANASQQAPKSSKEVLESLLDDTSPTSKQKLGRRKKKKNKVEKLQDERADEMK